MNVIKIANNLDEHLIRYTVSYACNFNCKDCYQETKRLQNKYRVSKELINNISKKINDLIESVPNDGKPITLYPEGGEISLWNLTDDILKNITTKRLTGIKIVSNFSADIDWYKKLVNYCETNNLQLRILLSYHHNQMPLDLFKSKILELNKIYSPKVLVVVDNENYKDHTDILEFLKNNNIRFNLNFKRYGKPASEEVHNFILSYMGNSDQSKTFTVYFDDESTLKCNGETLRLKGFFKPAGYYCDNNKNYDILPDGTVKHFGCPMAKEAFNLLTDSIHFDNSIILCNRTEDRPCNISCQNHNIWK